MRRVISVGLRRLSIAQCRRLLGRTTHLNDTELERVRDQLYSLAEVLVEHHVKHRTGALTIPSWNQLLQSLRELDLLRQTLAA